MEKYSILFKIYSYFEMSHLFISIQKKICSMIQRYNYLQNTIQRNISGSTLSSARTRLLPLLGSLSFISLLFIRQLYSYVSDIGLFSFSLLHYEFHLNSVCLI